MKRRRHRAARLRTTVQLLPQATREAMLRGIEDNEIIVGAYTDSDGGVCPMLAAHRNGGRTSFASFARAWDDFTRARRPRRATRREVGALRSYLEMSLLADETRGDSLVELAAGIRAERRAVAERRAAAPVPRPGDRFRGREPSQRRGSWLRPARRLDVFEATLAAASEEHSEQSAAEVLGEVREPSRAAHPAG
jgi:hypothetical protein